MKDRITFRTVGGAGVEFYGDEVSGRGSWRCSGCGASTDRVSFPTARDGANDHAANCRAVDRTA